MKKATFSINQFDIRLNLELEIDEETFTADLAGRINRTFSGHQSRLKKHGSAEEAALRLIACECFAVAAFNGLIDEDDVMRKFNWSIGEGRDDFPSFEEMGLKLTQIDNLQFDTDWIETDYGVNFIKDGAA